MFTIADKRAGALTTQSFPVKMLDMDITEICPLACHYCTVAGTPILLIDGTNRRIEEVTSGTKLLAHQKVPTKDGKKVWTKLVEAEVLECYSREAPVVEVRFSDRPPIFCTPDHLWKSKLGWTQSRVGRQIKRVGYLHHIHVLDDEWRLGYLQGVVAGDGCVTDRVYPKGVSYITKAGETRYYAQHVKSVRVVMTDDIVLQAMEQYAADLGLPAFKRFDASGFAKVTPCHGIRTNNKHLFRALTDPPEAPTLQYKRGWLAGFYDAEGSRDGTTLKLSQNAGPTLDQACAYLTNIGIPFLLKKYKGSGSCIIEIFTLETALQFLGQCPPQIERKRLLVGHSPHVKRAVITDVISRGIQTVYSLRTSTGTYIAGGLLSKNCYKNKMVGRRMDLHLAEQAIDTLFYGNPEPGPRSTHFFGGEPLAAWEVIKHVVQYAKEQSAKTGYLYSWGATSSIILLDQDKVDFFKANGGSIHVSIDGNPEAHDATRKFHSGKGSSDLVAKKVPLALAITPGDTARATIPASNAHLLLESMKYIKSLGFLGCAPIPVFEDDWTADFWCEFEDQMRKTTEWWCESLENKDYFYLKYIHDSIRAIIKPVKSAKPCGAGRTLLAVDMDGTVTPCHRFSGALKKAKKMGKIGETLDLSIMKDFQDYDATQHDWPECQSCEAYYACSGGCPHISYEYWGRIDRNHPNYCKFTQMAYRHSKQAFERVRRSVPELVQKLFGSITPGRSPR